MQTWKLSIKPDSSVPSNDVLAKCKEKSLIGVGWHHGYVEKQPKDPEEAKNMVKKEWNLGKLPYQLRYFLEDIEPEDQVWIHQQGKYYLSKVENAPVLYGRDIDPEFDRYDLGHARKAAWVEVPAKFVSGQIQRGTIAQRTIQRIHTSPQVTQMHERLFNELRQNPEWDPEIDDKELENLLSDIPHSHLFSLMTPDDVEDVVAAYLQSREWVLIKSTCFRSKPKFEFVMLHREGKLAHVQVKSGELSLEPSEYEKDADDKNLVFLFSTRNENPYPGRSVRNVYPIQHEELCGWIRQTVWAITLPLKIRLWIFLNNRENTV